MLDELKEKIISLNLIEKTFLLAYDSIEQFIEIHKDTALKYGILSKESINYEPGTCSFKICDYDSNEESVCIEINLNYYNNEKNICLGCFCALYDYNTGEKIRSFNDFD